MNAIINFSLKFRCFLHHFQAKNEHNSRLIKLPAAYIYLIRLLWGKIAKLASDAKHIHRFITYIEILITLYYYGAKTLQKLKKHLGRVEQESLPPVHTHTSSQPINACR
jgi:hypothetical protein